MSDDNLSPDSRRENVESDIRSQLDSLKHEITALKADGSEEGSQACGTRIKLAEQRIREIEYIMTRIKDVSAQESSNIYRDIRNRLESAWDAVGSLIGSY